ALACRLRPARRWSYKVPIRHGGDCTRWNLAEITRALLLRKAKHGSGDFTNGTDSRNSFSARHPLLSCVELVSSLRRLLSRAQASDQCAPRSSRRSPHCRAAGRDAKTNAEPSVTDRVFQYAPPVLMV